MSAESTAVEPGWLPATPDWFWDALQRWDASGTQSNRGHAYLVVSEGAAEANLFNRVLAAALLCFEAESREPCGNCKGCRAYRQGAHGDLMTLEREEGKRAISIEQVRLATRFLQQTALYGERKILLVQEADLMTPAAANSLLKTLEEPSGSSLLLLSTASAWRLPPTVRSRCQTLHLPKASPASAALWLAEQTGWPANEVDKALRMTDGNPVSAWYKASRDATYFSGALEESFSALQGNTATHVGVPEAWSRAEPEVLLERLLPWIERHCRHADANYLRHEGVSWMRLHYCVAELQGRIKSGATPGSDILVAEVYRLCRSREHAEFSKVSRDFLANIGRLGLGG
jgi:DNA polymerase-3 subunit delta'